MALTELEFARLNRTEKIKLIENFMADMAIALSIPFSAYSTNSGIYRNILKLAEESLLSVDSAIDLLATELALAENDRVLPKKDINKILKDTVGLTGTIKESTKGSTDKALASISSELRRLSSSGMNNDEIRRAVLGTKSLGYNDGLLGTIIRSKDIVSDTANKLAVTATEQAKNIADPDIIGYIWNSTFDNTCARCMSLQGKKFYYAKSGFKPLPPLHINCNCYTNPIYSQASGKKTKEVLTFKEYAKKPENQDALKEGLGATRYDLLTKGKLDINRFSSVRLEPFTLDEIKKRSPLAFTKAKID